MLSATILLSVLRVKSSHHVWIYTVGKDWYFFLQINQYIDWITKIIIKSVFIN